ncbi:MAG: hypothetical protein RL018_1719 [Pseudomonadota bacterium]|jgi:hypothetical protein
MNGFLQEHTTPLLPKTQGLWRAIYWEPVLMTGERICIGFVTYWDHSAKAVLTIRPDLLIALFGGAGLKAQQLLVKAIRILNSRLVNAESIEKVSAPYSGFYFSEIETCYANNYEELVEVGKIMSSSLSTLSEPDSPDAVDDFDSRTDNNQPNRQFVSRIKDLVIASNVNLAAYFNREASLLSQRRSVKFGYLSNTLAAHFGLLQPSNIQRHVRMARGLMTEVSLAAKHSGRSGLLILGYPPLDGATLTDKERSALCDYVEELSLESADYNVKFFAATNDIAARDALLAEV